MKSIYKKIICLFFGHKAARYDFILDAHGNIMPVLSFSKDKLFKVEIDICDRCDMLFATKVDLTKVQIRKFVKISITKERNGGEK